MRNAFKKCVLFSIFAFFLTGATDPPEPETSTQPASDRTDLRALLRKYGTTYSIYFTIEQDQFDFVPGKMGFLLQTRYVRDPDNFKTREAFLDALRKWYPEAEVKEDELEPKVVHIRAKALDKHENLFLDEKASLTFEGKVKDLLDIIVGRSAERFRLYNGGSITSVPYDDQVLTKIDVKDQTYRTLLSKAIPLARNRILWEANVIKVKEKPVTLVNLSWQ